jgi:hypothetical protein
MSATLVTGTDNRLSPSEVEDLHIRMATALSLNDPNINTESIVSDILSGRSDPVPLYTSTTVDTDDQIREQISANTPEVWNSIFKVIENGQIDALDHFVKLGLDLNTRHPTQNAYPIYYAVKFSQTNMMRHLINLHADVNVWSASSTDIPFYYTPDLERARTPLMCAAEQGNLNICKILCESAFADPMLIAPDGQTAQRLAARKGHREIVRYLPAHRGGSFLRLKCAAPFNYLLIVDDYNHRWGFIRKASKGIYIFFKVLLFEIPKFLFFEVPWEILKASKRGIVKLYRAIPPLKEWPDIVSRAMVSMAKGIKTFFIELAKGLKATPKVVYKEGKYLVKRTWKGIKAIPRLVKIGAEKTWSGLKLLGTWIKELLMRFDR